MPEAQSLGVTSRLSWLDRRARPLLASLRTPSTQRTLAWVLVFALILIDVLLVGHHALVRYQSYRADAFDLGNMDQAVWNTLHGHPFRFTNRGLDWFGPPTRLGIHVEPIILLIAPLYLIHAGPETLLVLQTVALALGAVPLLLLALRRLPDLPLVGATFVGAYLIAPELLGSQLWDFHPVALATPLLLLALWALDARRYGWFLLAIILAALTKEDVALAVIPLGVYLALWCGKPRFGAAVALVAALYVAICFRVILPHFNGGISGGNNYWYRYAWLGPSADAAVVNVLTHPWLPFTYVLGDADRRGYLGMLLRTAGGLGIFAPALWICALPELAVNVLSAHSEQYSGFFQYNAVLLPFLMAAGVYGAEAWYAARTRVEAGTLPSKPVQHGSSRDDTPSWRARLSARGADIGSRWIAALGAIPVPARWIGPVLVVWLVATGCWNLATANGRFSAFWHAGDGPIARQAQIDALLARVPSSASVAATDALNPHLSDRYDLYLMPDPQSYAAAYVAFDISGASEERQPADQRMVAAMVASGRYVVVGNVGTVTLLHRVGAPLTPPPGETFGP